MRQVRYCDCSGKEWSADVIQKSTGKDRLDYGQSADIVAAMNADQSKKNCKKIYIYICIYFRYFVRCGILVAGTLEK